MIQYLQSMESRRAAAVRVSGGPTGRGEPARFVPASSRIQVQTGGGRGGGHGVVCSPPGLRGRQRQHSPSLGGDTTFRLPPQKQGRQWQGPLGPTEPLGLASSGHRFEFL